MILLLIPYETQPDFPISFLQLWRSPRWYLSPTLYSQSGAFMVLDHSVSNTVEAKAPLSGFLQRRQNFVE